MPRPGPKVAITEIRREIRFRLDEQLFGLLRDYHEASRSQDPNRMPSDTIRELLYAGITHSPTIAVVRANQYAVKRRLEIWMLEELRPRIDELKSRVDELVNQELATLREEGIEAPDESY